MDATSNYQSNSDDSSLEISFIDPSLLNNDGIDYESSQAWPDPFINQQHGNNGLPTPTFEPWTTISHTNQSLGCQGVAMGSSQASLSGVPYQPDDTHQMVPLFGQWPDTHPHQQSGTNWSLWQPLQNWPVAASSQGTAINLITPESLPATLPHSLPTTPGNSKDQQLSNKKPVLKSSQPWTATSSSEQSHTSGSTFESYQSEPNACLHCRKQGQPASDEEDPFTYSSSTTATDMEVPMIPCPQCLQAFYCTADCAKADYPNHLPLCDSIASNPPRPSPNHKRAILFPATKAQPEIYYLLGMSGMRQCLSLDIDQYPGTHVLCPEIKRKGVPAYTIRISIRPNALYDGTWPNQSIPATAEYKTHYSWRGNVVIYVRPDVRPTRVRYRDIDIHLEDYQQALRFLAHYGTYTGSGNDFGPLSFWIFPTPHLTSLAPHRGSKAVLILCPAHAHLASPSHALLDSHAHPYPNPHPGPPPRFSTMMVRRHNPAFLHCAPLPLTQALGIPLLMRALPGDAWRPGFVDIDMGMGMGIDGGFGATGRVHVRSATEGLRNEIAGVLALGTGEVERGEGWIGNWSGSSVGKGKGKWWEKGMGREREDIYGTVVLIRQDGCELEMQHVEALLRFCQWVAVKRLRMRMKMKSQAGTMGCWYGAEGANENENERGSGSETGMGMQFVTKQIFEAFWYWLLKTDPGWAAGVTSPYRAEWKERVGVWGM